LTRRLPAASPRSPAQPAAPDLHRPEYAPTRHLVVEQLRQLCLEIGMSGLALPGEVELAQRLGVGRPTLRDALTRLEAEA